jgi:uncharacterized protein
VGHSGTPRLDLAFGTGAGAGDRADAGLGRSTVRPRRRRMSKVVRDVVTGWTRWLVLLACLQFCRAAHGAVASAMGMQSRLAGTWVGLYERSSGEPAFVAIQIDESRSAAKISVTIRSERVAGAPANASGVEGDRVAFDVRREEGGAAWHFDLVRVGGRLTGNVEQRSARDSAVVLARFSLSLQRPLDLKLNQFQPFVGDYRLADVGRAIKEGKRSDEDVFFVGYGSNAANGNSDYAYVTLGDRMLQIVPVGPDRFLADDGSQLAFEHDSAGSVTRLRWTDAKRSRSAASSTEADRVAQIAERVEIWHRQDVSFETRGAVLSGTLYLPALKGPHAALVFVDSGPQLRLEDWPMADRFARAGIACLSYDQRGTGKSTGDGEHAGFEVLADDALAAVDHLRDRPEIRPNQVGLWGAGDAGWVIPIAANKSDHVAFCIPVSGGAVSPADQELWRRSQYLQFLGCDAPLQEFTRRGTAMYFQWEELYKAGRFPIRPPFGVESRDLYFDAAAAIRRIRQPVLAIFGEMDMQTPPQESAAIWANELAAGGNRDNVVRVFSHATHALLVSDRPFDVLPESRLAPGYLKTTMQWIASHTRAPSDTRGAADAAGPSAAGDTSTEPQDAVAVAVAPNSAQSRGMDELPWYGSTPVQVILLMVGLLGSLWTLAFWPSAWAVRKFRRMPRRGPPTRDTIILGSVTHASALALSGALLALLRILGQASPGVHFKLIQIGLWGIAALAIPIAAIGAFLVRSCVRANRRTGRTRVESVSAWVSAATACAWALFFAYWTWIPLLSNRAE